MDSDRRSGYFQNQDNAYAASTRSAPKPHAHNSSMASNFQNRTSRDFQNTIRDPYQDAGKTPGGTPASKDDDENGWNVYADFNNAGPRYSSLKKNDGYQTIPSPSIRPPPSVVRETDEQQPHVELVTVPALGAEWKAEELRAMTKKGRKEDRTYERQEKWKEWMRDQRGICGKWGTRRAIVWGLFITICIVGIILAFTLPRVPSFTWNKDAPLTAVNDPDNPPKFATVPAATFAFNASLDVHIDTGSNFLPLKFNYARVQIADLDTGRLIAEGGLEGYILPAKAYTQVYIPVMFNYTAANNTDQTWANMYNACKNSNQYPDRVRPGVNLSVAVQMGIAGLVTHPATSTVLTSAPCPFELDASHS
ncbi:hypothetical protein FRC18_005595 [Serendipita sp. 400]|nr:hypothetical protein FRC18_005595 [Serendipita sp. 400]